MGKKTASSIRLIGTVTENPRKVEYKTVLKIRVDYCFYPSNGIKLPNDSKEVDVLIDFGLGFYVLSNIVKGMVVFADGTLEHEIIGTEKGKVPTYLIKPDYIDQIGMSINPDILKGK